MSDEVSVTEAYERREEVLFLDVREQHEWDAGHIDGAVHVPMGELGGRLEVLDGAGTVVAVCRSGARSGAVTTALRDAGHGVVNMVGGMKAWAAADLPFTAEDDSAPRVA